MEPAPGTPGAARPGQSTTCRLGYAAALTACLWAGLASATADAQPAVVDAPRRPVAQAEVDGEAALARGDVDTALALAGRLSDGSPTATFIRARVAELRGHYDESLRLMTLAAADDPTGEAALRRGLLLRAMGRGDEAAGVLAPVVESAVDPDDGPALLRAARAARALGRFRIANNLFRAAASAAPGSARVNTEWGELLLEKDNLPDAKKSFAAAIEADPQDARAHLGLARVELESDRVAALEAAGKALAANPTLVEARVVLAGLALDADRHDEARAHLSRALEVNANSLEAHALLAAIDHVEGKREAYEAQVRRVLAVNPTYGEVYRVTASRLAGAYRFDEAVAVARRAIEVDPDNARARAELGLHLMRTGQEDEARVHLAAAFDRDPYDVVTFNLLGLLDTLESFQTIAEGDLVVRLHPEEAPVLGDTVVRLAREALQTLSARYGAAPRGPILVEVFPRHDDFAVRTLGVPGMVGALGACFGRVVTLDSPRARPPGTFNWQATLWHEMAHVVTLQMSGQRVPRWLSEGVSVYEERRARAHWGRESDFVFVTALARDEILPLSKLPEGFSNPRTIALAYHQAGLFVDYVVSRFGEAALAALVRAYGDGANDGEAFARALGADGAQLQTGFDAFLEQRLGASRSALALPDDLAQRLAAATPESLPALAASHPGAYPVQLALARARHAAGDARGAADAYAAAWSLVPMPAGSDGPDAALPGLLEESGRADAAQDLIEDVLRREPAGLEPARALARLASTSGDVRRLEIAAARLAEIVPFEADAHSTLGRAARARGDVAAAVRAFEQAVAAGPADPVAARTDLAEGLYELGRTGDARREVISALETAPRYERAQELLLKLVDGAQPAGERPR